MKSAATKFKFLAVMAVATSTLVFATTSFAGKGNGKEKVVPGKPGDATIVEIAVAVNDGGAGEFVRPLPRARGSDGPLVEVKTRQLRLRMSNSGSYIPAAERARIFGRFEQLAGRDRESGTGIGLALVKELVDLHDGSIEVDSDEESANSSMNFPEEMTTACTWSFSRASGVWLR